MERIIITFEKSGAFRGASLTDFDGLPKALDMAALDKVLPVLNASTLARVTELEATIKADKEASDALLEATKTDATAKLAEATAAHSLAMAEAQKLIAEAAPLMQAAQAEIEVLKARVIELTPPPVPPSIKAWQAKAVLELSGILDAAESIIRDLDEPQRTVVLVAWLNNTDFSRQSPTILALAAKLELTDEQLDAMFQQAAALTI